MKLKNILIKFLILTVAVCGTFALTSCVSSAMAGAVAFKACSSAKTNPTVNGLSFELNADETEYTLVSVREDLREVVIPEKVNGLPVTAIGNYAFVKINNSGCSGAKYYGMYLKSLTIPASVREVTANAFVFTEKDPLFYGDSIQRNNSVEKLYFEGTAEEWLNIDFFSSPLSENTELYIGGEQVTSFTVPESVTQIKDNAFFRYKNLQSVQFHDGVKTIGGRAFYRTGLSELNLPENLTEIKVSAFDGCDKLANITFNPKLSLIGVRAFRGCGKLTELDMSSTELTGIYSDAFYGCSSVLCVKIPATLEIIGSSAFGECVKLYEVYNLSRLNIRAGQSENGEIAKNAIIVHKSLDEPSIIAVKGDFQFVRRPDESGYNYLIEYFGDDSEIILPNDLDGEAYRISGHCFKDRKNLTRVSMPSSVDYIGEEAFSGCIALKTIEGTEGVLYLGAGAFKGCESLTAVTFGDLSVMEESTFEGSGIKEINLETVTEIRYGAFKNCKALITAKLSEGLTKIGASAFEGCAVLSTAKLSEGLTKIGASAFKGCSVLNTAISSEVLTEIGASAFEGCAALTGVVNISSGAKKLGDGAFKDSGVSEVVFADGGAEEIGKEAFAGCKNLKSVTLGDGLLKIGESAFANDTALEALHIPASVESLYCDREMRCIFNCPALKSLTVDEGNTIYYSVNNCIVSKETGTILFGCAGSVIPADTAVSKIDAYAFYGSGLTSVTVPENITTIGYYAFAYSGLISATVSGAENIGDYVFYGCKSLTEVNLEEGITYVPGYAFYECESLKNITLPEGVISIGIWAFADSGLERINLPSSLTYISTVFTGNTALKEIRYAGTRRQWNDIKKNNDWLHKEVLLYCADSTAPIKLKP